MATKFFRKYEAPLANASSIFSAGFVGAKSAEAENSSHSSTGLRPRFSAKADKRVFFGVGIITTLTLVLSLGFVVIFNLNYRNKIFPEISVAGIDVSGKTKSAAIDFLKEKVPPPPEKIILTSQGENFEIRLEEIEFAFAFDQTSESAFMIYRSDSTLNNLINRLRSPAVKKDIGLNVQLNQEKLNEFLSVISSQNSKGPTYPGVFLDDKTILVEKGSPGVSVDIGKLKREIMLKFASGNFSETPIPTFTTDPTISEADAENLVNRATKLIDKKLVLNYQKKSLTFSASDLVILIAPNRELFDEALRKFIAKVSEKVNAPPQNAVFKLESGKAAEFLPAKDGLIIKENELWYNVSSALSQLEETDEKTITLEIPLDTTPPEVTTKDVNNLGINDLIGVGSSKFAGSIASRIHNVGLASSRFNGVLVAPQEAISFNKILGDVSSFTGYKQAYIIKDGKTILGDGGGVCQVSTTLFRALLNAGLPIVERRAHSYRVGYYEQNASPGLDATVFDPTTDLKFINDTPGHILIQTTFDPTAKTLTFELYGTNDGRVATLTKPTPSSIVPPPEDAYIDDPTLPMGKTKQIEYKAWGARASFNYKVEKEGTTIFEKTFISNYRPWGAVYLRGTGPVN